MRMAAGNAVGAPEAGSCPAAAAAAVASTLAQPLSISARCSSIVSPAPLPLQTDKQQLVTRIKNQLHWPYAYSTELPCAGRACINGR